MTGGHLGAGPGRGRADGGAAPCVRHATRPADLGRRPPVPTRTRSSPAGASASAPCASPAASRASPGARRATTTRSAPRTARPRSRPGSAWRRRAKLEGVERNVIAVIGDGAMSAGMAYEAMNNTGAHARAADRHPQRQRHVDRPAGRGDERHLSKLVSSQTYRGFRHVAKQLTEYFPKRLQTVAGRAEGFARGLATGGTLFEELGFYYIGPLDGHNLDHLIPVLENVRDAADRGPVLIHVVTQKGKGYAPAERVDRQVSRRQPVRRHHRHAAEGQVERAVLHLGVRQGAGRARRHGRPRSSRSPRRCRPAPGSTCSRRRIPERCFDVAHRRAARGHLRRRPCDRGLPPVLRDLLDLPAARLRPGGARRRDPGPAGAVRDRPRRAGRRRRRHPCRLVRCRLSRLPAGLRDHGGRRRARADADGGDRRAP